MPTTGVLSLAMLEQAVIDAEAAHGLIPADAMRPTMPHERHVDFAGIDDALADSYRQTAQAIDGVRQAVLDAMTDAIGGAEDPVKLATTLRDFAATQPPTVRKAVAGAVDDIARSLAQVHNRAGEMMTLEAKRQGQSPFRKIKPATAEQFIATAQAGPQIMWQRINTNAAEALTPRADADDVLQAARGTSPKGAEDNARQAAHVAHGEGRMAAIGELPQPKRQYASELLDSRTCEACARIDGHEYPTLDLALDDYPGAGPYRNCAGGARCRGTLVFVWDEDQPGDVADTPAPPAPPEPGAKAAFDRVPLAGHTVNHPDLSLLTHDELLTAAYYAGPGYRDINEALRGHAPMTPEVADMTGQLRSALRKYPLPDTIRVTRETEAADFGLARAADAPTVGGETLTEAGFLSTQVTANPHPVMDRKDPVVLDLVVPAGTPSLRVTPKLTGDKDEAELLLIDAKRYRIDQVVWDDGIQRWRLRARIETEPEG